MAHELERKETRLRRVRTRVECASKLGRHAITARCQSAYVVNAPLKAAEYKLTLSYRAYPWPRHRTTVYRIAAQINGNGQVTGWKLN